MGGPTRLGADAHGRAVFGRGEAVWAMSAARARRWAGLPSAETLLTQLSVLRAGYFLMIYTCSMTSNLDLLWPIDAGLRHKFPSGHTPWQMLARVLEEGGELAQQVAHFEDSGIKRQKYGEPDRSKLAAEIKGVLIAAIQIAQYYDLETELRDSIDWTYQNLLRDGHIAKK
jgi:NTP pyrophosphatase (non-canonical NTP hydrolase)